MTSRSGLGCVDHLVWSTPDLDLGIRQIEELTGVRPIAGGSHPGAGTRNALLPLGARVYLEIIAPDPDQAEYRSPRVFRLDSIERPKLVTWAASAQNIDALGRIRFADGQSLGEAVAFSRTRPDGVTLSWSMTDPYVEIDDGVVPFLIDWGETLHPSSGLSTDIDLQEVRIHHPQPVTVQEKLSRLEIDIEVLRADRAGLVAVLDSPAGRVELR